MRTTLTLSGYWLFILGALGVFFPYFTLYLRENVGLNGAQVGVVFAVLPCVGMLAQPLWGFIADHTGSRTRVLTVIATGTALGYAGLGRPDDFTGMLLATAALASCSSALLPIGVSVSMAALSGGSVAFGRVRAVGTVGFLIMVVCTPWMLHAYQQSTGLQRLPDGPSEPGLGAVFLVAAALALAEPSANASRRPRCCRRTDHSGTSLRTPSRVKVFR